MNLRKSFVATVLGLGLIGSTALTGLAQDTATSSVTIGGGSFSASISASNFASLPYSLTNQYARNGSITLTVSDQTGDAAGWQITVKLTDFIGNTTPANVIESENLEILTYNIEAAADGSQPVSDGGLLVVTSETAPQLTWTAQPGFGQGSYNLTMIGDLLVPGRTTAQTYTSTGTLTIVTGP